MVLYYKHLPQLILHFTHNLPTIYPQFANDMKCSILGSIYTELEDLLRDRNGIETFRSFLTQNDTSGLHLLELWLTLKGYQKEYEKRKGSHDLGHMTLVNFNKWNGRCGRALVEKYFSKFESEIIQIQRLRSILMKIKRFPNIIENAEHLRCELNHVANHVQDTLRKNQFQKFKINKKSFEYGRLPPVSENEVSSLIDWTP